MPTLSQLQIPPPKTWQDFESLCCDLWRAIWKDPNAKRHGRQGQAQHGVDVFGNPSQQAQWAGVQCKGKDNYTDKTLAETELRTEVGKAKSFVPALAHFTMATTGPRDAHIQQVARVLSDDHRKAGLFTVDVWSWEDIVETLDQYPEVVAKHYPEFALTAHVREGFDQILTTQRESLSRQAETGEKLDSLTVAVLRVEQKFAPVPESLLATYHDSALDLAREYVNGNKPAQALEYLEQQKKVIWPQATPQVKARLLMVMGAAKLGIGEERRAAELFLEALQYAPDDEKAMSNAAVAYFLLDDLPQALIRANQVLERNPTNYQARSVAIQASQEPLDRIVAGLPEFCKDNRDVAFALGAIAKRQNSLDEAVHWYRVAAKDENTAPDIKAILGQTLLEQLQEDKQSPLQIGQLTDVIRSALEEIEHLLTEAWAAMPEEASRRSRLAWLVNRGIVRRLLGKLAEARADFEDSLRLAPHHPVAAYFYGTLADENGDTGKAFEMAQAIEPLDGVPQVPLFIADLLLRSKGPAEAIKYLEEAAKNGVPAVIDQPVKQMLAEAYQHKGNLDSAAQMCDSLLQAAPSNVCLLVLASQVYRAQGDNEHADTHLAKAMRCLAPTTPWSHVVILGDEFYALKRFNDAAFVYERAVQPCLDTPLTRRFLNACYQASRLDKALEVCECLKKAGPLQYVAEMASAIYEETGDLPAARKACEEYLQTAQDDAQMRIRLAVVDLRLRNDEAVDAFLANPPDWKSLPVDFAIQIANLLAVRERYREATELMYKIRRKHPEGKVHLRYIHSFLFHGTESHDWLEASVVEADTAVCVEDAGGNHQWFILDDSDDARIEAGEITSSHRLWRELLGKKVGDSVLLKESVISPEHGKITDIKSKYVRAFHECGEMLQTRYPEVEGFEAVHLPHDEKAGLDRILAQVGRQHDAQSRAVQVYQENPLPVGALAHLLGRNILEAWSALCQDREAKLWCCFGAPDELRDAMGVLAAEPHPTLVVDPVSLMTIDALGIRDDVVRMAGRLGIAQATVDLLNDTLHKRKAVNRNGFLTVGKEGETFVKHEVSAEDVERNLAWLRDLLGWIGTNCDVLPWPVSVRMARSDRHRLEELLGEESVDTILVAAGPGRILYSDDQWLRGLARVELGVSGVWTQALLLKALDSGTLERERCDQAFVSLVCAGYVHTRIDAHVLLVAAKKAGWRPVWPFDEVANVLRGPNCDEQSAVSVGADFVAMLWSEVILPESFDYLVLRLLDSLAHQRSPRHILNLLALGSDSDFGGIRLLSKMFSV